jgi:DNA (cytosine-5)-methyltransferase 3A
MNVLSLFDGMSCGHQALDRANIKVDKYFASEIDKYAINVTMANYPETIQLGDVRNLDGSKLPQIDLLIGGSPCQSFSFAGKKNGMATKCEVEILSLQHYLELKAEQYEFEGQSYLFWEFIRMMNEVKPKYFLLENVVMIEKWEKVLSKAIGVNPIKINSSLVSAQNRVRLYWTNIGMESSGFFGDLESIIKQPKDQCIFLRDILETDVDEKYFMSDKAVNGIMQHKKEQKEKGFRFGAVIKNENQKMNSLKIGGHGIDDLVLDSTFERTSNTGNNRQVRQLSENNKSNGGTQPYQQDRVYDINGIAPALQAQLSGGSYMISDSILNDGNRKIITYNLPELVSVRKYEVDIFGLQNILREHKNMSNQQIADLLKVPKTMVDHWFRTDAHFSIPDKDIWIQLKELLQIETNEFDESIMTFEEKENVFEKSNRAVFLDAKLVAVG